MAPGTIVLPKLPLVSTTSNTEICGDSCGIPSDISPSTSDDCCVGVSREVSPSPSLSETEEEEGFYVKWRRRLGLRGTKGGVGNDASTQTDYDPIVVESRAIFLDLFQMVKKEEEEKEVKGHHQPLRSKGSSFSVRSRASRTMWRVASELLVKHSIVYKSIVDKLELSSADPDYSAFRIMCDEVFEGGQVSWGRIIVLYALFIQVARECHRNRRDHAAWAVADFVGLYIGETISEWIAHEGGWGALEEAFPSNDVMEQTVWKGLLVTGIGLGVLATAIKAIR